MKSILIADDNQSGRELIRTVLEGCGYRVFEAADGQAAVEEAHRTRPDLIILDLAMPRLDGFGALAALRGSPDFALTPILALTASAMRGDQARATLAGFTSYLTKPIRLVDLRNEVTRLLAAGAGDAGAGKHSKV